MLNSNVPEFLRGAGFSPEQLAIITAPNGLLQANAGAGAGKTGVLGGRIAYQVIVKQIHPARILALTFNKDAALELKERLFEFGLDSLQVQQLNVRTLHSFCYQEFRSNPDLYLPNQAKGWRRGFKAAKIVPLVDRLAGLEFFKGWPRKRLVKVAKGFTDYLNRRECPVEFPYQDLDLDQLIELLHHNRGQEYSYEELPMQVHQILYSNPDYASRVAKRFQFIAVDEVQDFCAQYLNIVFKLVLAGNRNLTIVGDPNQSIFEYNGVDATNFEALREDFAQYSLIINYRSNAKLGAFFNTITAALDQQVPGKAPSIPMISYRGDLPGRLELHLFPTELAELRWLVEQNKQECAVSPANQVAVLFRTMTGQFYQRLELGLTVQGISQSCCKHDIPTGVQADPEDKFDARTRCTHERISRNSNFILSINLLKFSLGVISPSELDALLSNIPGLSGDLLTEARLAVLAGQSNFAESTQSQQELLRSLLAARDGISRYLDKLSVALTFVQEWLENLNKESLRLKDTTGFSLISSTAAVEAAKTLSRFITMFLDSTADFTTVQDLVAAFSRQAPLEVTPVLFSSIHKIKGRAWQTVFIPRVTDYQLPFHHRNGGINEAEEFRVFYVAATRARNNLIMTATVSHWGQGFMGRSYAQHNRQAHFQLTRFLTDELKQQLQIVQH